MPSTLSQSEQKPLWKGVFMRSGQEYEEWCRAETEALAFVLLTARVAMQMGTTSYNVRNFFHGKPNSYKITKEVQK